MSARRLVSFEVYYMQNGRWQIHARFGANAREEATDEAKRLDTGGFEASCVIRETFDNANNTSEEVVVYHSPSLKTKPSVSHITGSGGRAPSPPPEGSAAANAMVDAKKREKAFIQKQKKEAAAHREEQEEKRRRAAARAQEEEPQDAIGEMLAKLLMVCFISLIPAGLTAYAAYFAFGHARTQGIPIDGQVAQFTLIGVFILAFTAFFVPLLRKYVTFGSVSQNSDLALAGVGAAAGGATPLIDVVMPRRDPDGLEQMAPFELPDDLSEDLTEPEPEVEPEAQLEPELESEAEQEAPGPEPIVMTPQQPLVYEADPDLPPEEAEVASELAVQPIHDAGSSDPAAMTDELERMELEARRVVGERLDDYTRFGLTLFFAGAGEALARKFKIIGQAAMDILVQRVKSFGNSDAMARGFVANIEEYLLEDRYFGMYRRGRSAAYRRIVDPNAPLGLDEALEEWRNPKRVSDGSAELEDAKAAERPGQKFVAVFFTDIVDSTAKQQSNGDHWMMDVIRAHNEIVRGGIKRYEGREIKHTGDGIMATFPSAECAVEASILMQKGFRRFSDVMPDRGFEVRVGISAGEPIHEGGDIFGTPVNLAARVLSKTDANEICVSSVVRDLCQGKRYAFQHSGNFELKGFPEAQAIYRVVFSISEVQEAA